MRTLLDKNVVRRWTEALLNISLGRPETSEQLQTLELVASVTDRLCITKETYNILTTRVNLPKLTHKILAQVQVLYPTRYFKRWLRRISENISVSREDAALLAYGTFSTDEAHSFLGTHKILTFDSKLVNEVTEKKQRLEKTLSSMTKNLKDPYCQAKIPELHLI